MQKAALVVESLVMVAVLGVVLGQRYQRPLKRWWRNWRARPKRVWHLQPRTPDGCQDCRLAKAEMGPGCSQTRRAGSVGKSRQGTTENT
jgi:hypothetical protein